MTSHNPLLFIFCKTSKTQHFRFFSSFLGKLIFKVEYLENGLVDFNDFDLILQDFELPFR